MAITESTPDVGTTRHLLNIVLVIGVLDALLLLVLLYVAFIDRNESAISIIGPIHGLGFLALLGLTAKGSLDRRWGWWFPALVLVTTGPLGSIVGDLVVRRQLRSTPAS